MFRIVLFLFFVFLENALASKNIKYVDITEYPYHVSIEKYGNHECSGALIHESWVITVASCVFHADPSTITIRVRSSTLLNNGDVLEIANIIVHEDFHKFFLLNDIALLKLKVPAQFGEKLLPIGLPYEQFCEPSEKTLCYVTGWRYSGSGPPEPKLTVTTIPLVNQSTCNSLMPCHNSDFYDILCAGNMIYGVNTCQDDPGAPLMKGQTLIGVLSYGLGCKTMIHPGVYTRVSSYLPWIAENSGIRYATRDDIRETTMSTLPTFTENARLD